MRTTVGAAALIAFLGLAAACSTSTGPGAGPNVSLSFSTQAAGAMAAPARASTVATGADTLSDGSNTLIITGAQLVLKQIEMHSPEVASCDTTPEPAACEEFEIDRYECRVGL